MNGSNTPTPPLGLTGSWNHASDADWAEVLAGFPLFSGIARRRLRALVRHATVAEYGPGDVVVQKDEPGDSLYVILGGSAQVRGKPAARRLRTGDYFGELGLLHGAPRSATVVAAGELHVLRLPRDAFLRAARHEPTIALELLGTLGTQIRRLEARAA